MSSHERCLILKSSVKRLLTESGVVNQEALPVW